MLLLVLAASPATAQQLATVTGHINDSSGNPIVGADITLTNSRTSERHTTVSRTEGAYTIPFVKPGRHTLAVESPGLSKYTLSRIEVETGATVRADARLRALSVSIRANPSLLNTDHSAASSVIRNRTILYLPLLGRRAAHLASLSGFVVQRAGTQLQVAGGRSNNAVWTLDGGSTQDNLLGVADLQFDPPVEALNEVHLEASNYRAELGRSGGAVVQLTSLAGTNQFRGIVYEYLRNDSLDTRSFFARDKRPLRGNQFGGSYGGPIVKNRTFFQFSAEWRRRRSSNPQIENIPDTAETRGDFSELEALIRNPTTGDPIPNNIIPASQLDPVGLAAAELWPAPNIPGRPSRNLNYFADASDATNAQTLFFRLDHTIAEKHRIFGRFAHSLSDREDQSNIWPDPVHNNHQLTDATYFNASVTTISNVTRNLTAESRVTWSRRKQDVTHASAGRGVAQQIGFSGANPGFLPGLRFTSGVQPIGRFFGQGRLQNPIRDTLLASNWTYATGKHSLKWGGEARFSRTDDVSFFQAGGALSFNPIATGDTVASLLHGWVAEASRNETIPLRSRAAAIAAYIQDDWKLTPKLTLNLGLRYDLDTPRWESFDNRQNSFDADATNPACSCPGSITFSGRDGRGRYAHNFAAANFSPRFGFAYRPSENWVLRGGGAIVYIGQYDQATSIAANAGFSIRGQFVGMRPSDQAFALRDGLPEIATPQLTPGFGAVPIGQPTVFAPEFFQPESRPNPYLVTYNLHIQRRLSKTAFAELGYIATLGRKLTLPGSATLNQIHPSQIHLIDQGAPAQTLRPFPQFSDVRMLAPNFGASAYHGLNLRLLKRVSAGLEFGMNYTFSRSLDNVEARNELGGEASAAPFANQYDRRQAWSLGGNHIKHRYIGHAVWDIPYGKRRENEFVNRWWNHLIGGWTLSTIVELRSGAPFSTIWGGAAQIYPTADRVRADATAPYRENPNWRNDVRAQTFFDPTSFAQPQRFTVGNVGRNAFIGPGSIRSDAALIRRIHVPWDSHNMQIRAEVFNLLNRASFGLPEGNAQSASFGRITTLAPGAAGRLIQLGVRYAF